MSNLFRNILTKATQISPKSQIHHQIASNTRTFRKMEHSACCSDHQYQSVRSSHYAAKLRAHAMEGNLLRFIRNEIQYTIDHSATHQFAPKCGPFEADERPGEQFIILKRKYGEKEDIKIEVTMFDGSVPSKQTGSVPGEEKRAMHITFIVHIHKEGGDIMEFLCSAWPDSIVIERVFVHVSDQKQMPAHPYRGPKLKELDDDELQESLYEFLEARDISDNIAVYLHKYMAYKDKTEYIKWMGRVKSFVEPKLKNL